MEPQPGGGPDFLTRSEVKRYLRGKIPKSRPDEIIDDAVFLEIESLLKYNDDFQPWIPSPRLYCLLRMLPANLSEDGPVFKSFLKEELDDLCLPFREFHLPQVVRDEKEIVDQFLDVQDYVLSKSECMNTPNFLPGNGDTPPHRHLHDGGAHFKQLGGLGHGGSSTVERVMHKLSGIQFARKRIPRGETLAKQKAARLEFSQELNALRKLRHKHLVRYVGSYTDLFSFSLILSPVAEMDLNIFLLSQTAENPLPPEEISWLRSAFGCIASALLYLHEAHIRHKDIKPGNILLNGGVVYLCDFGIAYDWSSVDHSTTTGPTGKYTLKYSAPEVVNQVKRNEASDIWSLGCVFLEMVTVLKGFSLAIMDKFIEERATYYGKYWNAPDGVKLWVRELRKNEPDDAPLDWIDEMIHEAPSDRLSAKDLVNTINSHFIDCDPLFSFVGPCCVKYPTSKSSEMSFATHSDSEIGSSAGMTRSPEARIVPTFTPYSPPTSLEGRTSRVSEMDITHPEVEIADRRTSSLSVPRREYSIRSDSIVSSDSSNRRSGLRFSIPSETVIESEPSLATTRSQSHVSGLSIKEDPIPIINTEAMIFECFCGRRPSERLVFKAPIAAGITDNDREILPVNPCESQSKSVYLFEEATTSIWKTTRRLVFSWPVDGKHGCRSFWLPLGDISLMIDSGEVKLIWSDCNHIKAKSSGDYGEVYDWKYDPERPNHQLSIEFSTLADSQKFIDRLRCPSSGDNVLRSEKVAISREMQAQLYNVTRTSPRRQQLELHYRMIVLSEYHNSGSLSFRVFVVWPDIDLWLHMFNMSTPKEPYPRFQFTVQINNMTSPNYLSDIEGEPAPDPSRIAACKEVVLRESAASLPFPIGFQHTLPDPPEAVVFMLKSLTGWTLTYYALCSRIRWRRKRITITTKDKKGPFQLMLWERQFSDTDKRCQFTLRTRAADDIRREIDPDKLWTSGTIPLSNAIVSSSGTEATIKIGKKTQGASLEITKMTATRPEQGREKPERQHRASATKDDHSEVTITFEDIRFCRDFVTLIERFMETASAAAASDPYPYSMRRSISSGIAQRGNSTSSADFSPKPSRG